MNYYLLLNGKQSGPFSLLELMSMWSLGEINSETLHWFDGLGEWLPLGTFVEEAIAEEKQKAQSRAARFVAVSKPASTQGWKRGEYTALVVITVLVPFIGFAMALLNIWNPEKRQQAGQLLGISIIMFAIGFVLLFR